MKNKKGLTLVEILIVVSIIVLLASITIPNIIRVREEAKIAKVLKELGSIGTAITLYEFEKGKSPKTWDDLKLYININKLKNNYEWNSNL